MCRHVCAQILQNDCLQDIASMSKHVAAWGRRIWPTACRTDVPACGGMCAYLLHVEATRPDVGGDQDARVAAAELANDGVALLLRHVAVHRAHRKVVLPHLLRKPIHLIRQPREFLISRGKTYGTLRSQTSNPLYCMGWLGVSMGRSSFGGGYTTYQSPPLAHLSMTLPSTVPGSACVPFPV